MADKKDINLQEYDISMHRYRELKYFCLQYEEWLDELKYKTEAVKSIQITDMPSSHGIGDSTGDLAIRRAELYKNCKLIEQTAIQADTEIYQYILRSVTSDVPFKYLYGVMNIPCGQGYFYKARRKFFWMLNKNKVG